MYQQHICLCLIQVFFQNKLKATQFRITSKSVIKDNGETLLLNIKGL